METGSVTLVGAGPGSADLLTLGGLRALREADVVLYDRLVGPEILEQIPAGVRRVPVGKRAGSHPVPQEEISRMLLELAQRGQRVARLKGGDPFVFGRGGEELALLLEHGISCRVLPGVTSAVAAPAWAGIPVTHRGFSPSFHVFTAHRAAGEAEPLEYSAIAGLSGTKVFLMAVSRLEEILTGLLEAGMDPETPAAVVQDGTSPRQREVISTAAKLARRAREEGIASPALLVVGEVCALREGLTWRSEGPLQGLSVLVACARAGGGQAEALRSRGAFVEQYPCVSLVPRREAERVAAGLNGCRWLVFTSGYGVELFFQTLEEAGQDSRVLGNVRIAAVGPKTAGELSRRGIRADYVPKEYGGEALGLGLARCVTAGDRVVLFRAAAGGKALPELLTGAGALVEDIAAYDTFPREQPDPELADRLARGEFDAVAVTSASAARGFAAAAGEYSLAGFPCVCAGPSAAREARRLGMLAMTAKAARAEAVADCLVRWKEERQ